MSLKVFKNKNFKKRDYECTNLVYAVGENMPEGEFWQETSEYSLIDGNIVLESDCSHLYTSCGVMYFGYL